MPPTGTTASNSELNVAKSPTGISGLDEITGGGLPTGRPTLITGGPGCGKTLLSMEFLIRGIRDYGEPGLFVSFEENEHELKQNIASLGFRTADLLKRRLLAIDWVRAERSEIEETGEYDLEGLFIRLGHSIKQIKAKRVVLDTIESLFAALPDPQILRAELRRLFRWLKDQGVTAIITAERGDGSLSRHGLEEYVSDCVILLDHRVNDQISTRRLRVVKYRGSAHGTNEYPFLIDETGVTVLPITSLSLTHEAPTARLSTGIPELDRMFGGKGLFRGSSVLVSGTPGSGKTSLAAHIIHAACARNECGLFFPFEESQQQLLRNMRSIGLHLGPWVAQALLRFHPARPNLWGLEMHLARMHKQIHDFEPKLVVIDPVSNLTDIGSPSEAKAMLTRLVDFLKARGITAIFTSLAREDDDPEQTPIGISSLMDTWLHVRNLENNGERNRTLSILKSRGMAHSNQIREFHFTTHGIELLEAYVGTSGILPGTARTIQERQDLADARRRGDEVAKKQRELARKRAAIETQIASLRLQYEADVTELETLIAERQHAEQVLDIEQRTLAEMRGGTASNGSGQPKKGATRGRSHPRRGRNERITRKSHEAR
jgi:circadian clock protein KaiC